MIAARARLVALDAVPILFAAGATAVAAQATVPFLPVPFTLQTFAAMASGLMLGARRGAASQATYLAMGAAGLPVFAKGGFGAATLVGPTAGYLWAFVLLAFLAGTASARLQGAWRALALFGASTLTLAIGSLWLARFVGNAAFVSGFLLFLPSEALKTAAAWGGVQAFRQRP